MTEGDEVLSRCKEPGGVRLVLASTSVRRALRRELGGLLGPSAQLGRCRLRRVKFKPGHKLSAYYDVAVGGEDGGSRAVAVTWLPSTPHHGGPVLDPSCPALEVEAQRRGVCAPFSHLVRRVPGMNMTMLVAPLDPSFPQLVRLTDPGHAAALLDIEPGAGSRVGRRPVQVTALRYRPGQRHVLRYQPVAAEAGAAVFAKLQRGADRPRWFQVATGVAALLEDRGDGLAAARPESYVAEDGVVLFEHAPGTPLSVGLRRGAGAVGARLELAGQLLRAVHEAPELGRDLDVADVGAEVRATVRASEHIEQLLPAAGAQVSAVAAEAGELLEQLPAEPLGLVHGDFKADHLLVSPRRLTLIDFDSCARAEPALDIGKMLADLRWWFTTSGREGLGPAQGRFLAGYAVAPGSLTLARARVYEALLLVKLAARRVPLYDLAWASLTSTLVASAEAALRALPRHGI